MAADWIKMRCNLWNDPRVIRLVDLTDTTEATVIGGLFWLWSTADQHSETGFLPGVSLRQIDRRTGIEGFGAALQSVGWAEVGDAGVTLARFNEHNGATAKNRSETARRVASHRKVKRECTDSSLQNQDSAVTSALAREREREREREEEKQKQKHSAQPAAAPVDVVDAGLPTDIPAPAGPTEEPPPKRKPQAAVEFPIFWAAFPVKKGKADALKAWKKAGLDGRAAELVAHVRSMEAGDDQWKRGFIPHPATYLNGQRWEDVPMRDKDVVAVTAPGPAPDKIGAKAALSATETKLEHAISWANQQYERGDFGTGVEALLQRDAEIAAARAKWGGSDGKA